MIMLVFLWRFTCFHRLCFFAAVVVPLDEHNDYNGESEGDGVKFNISGSNGSIGVYETDGDDKHNGK